MRRMKSQTRKVKKETRGARASSTPKPVATPLPPLPFKKMEKLWPQIAQIPTIIGNRAKEGKYLLAKRTGIAPFPISKSKVRAAGKGPTTRRTLVAPILWLPNSLMSILLKRRARRYPKGTDPIR